jgi:hypothetical protein
MTDTLALAITPEAMKAASRALRALIREKTGQDIAHSSVLNTLTNGLGLGPNFGAMLAANKPAPVKPHEGTTVLLAFDLTEAEMGSRPELQDVLYGIVQDLTQHPAWGAGWVVHDHYMNGASNTAAVWISRKGLAALPSAQGFLDTFDDGALALLAPLAARKGALACAFHSGGDVRQLSVDFQYRSTGQICTAYVQENVWKAVHDLGLDEADALYVVGYDVDIADETFEVLDTRIDFGTLWNA